MEDIEMRDQDAPSGVDGGSVETKGPKQEPSYPDKEQNPSEKTVKLETDVHLSVARGCDETGQVGDDGKNASAAEESETKHNGADMPEETMLREPSTPKAGNEDVKKWKTWLLSDSEVGEVDEAGTLEEQGSFIKEVESFHREHFLEFKAPKFYGQPLNCLKLWRAVIKLGGYDVVTSSKLWRQVGESFHPPKTCTTVSWTFRIFYEKALLEYERYLKQSGELNLPGSPFILPSCVEKEVISPQGLGSSRARRDAAARAMQGWHTQRLIGSAEDKGLNSTPKQKNLKSVQKLKTPTSMDLVVSHGTDKQLIAEVHDVGPPADWVKINVRETKDCFEIYALVPGLLREEVRVQSDPAGRLVITGQPQHLDNPWGITPFQKIVNLPARIDPLNTSAVVSLHGRLFVRVPFEQ